MKKLHLTHRATCLAGYIGYVTQAIMINFMPLLYVTLREEYGLTLGEISGLIIANFVSQLTADLIAAKIGDRISMRAMLLFTHLCASVGLCSIGILPQILPSPYLALLIAEIICGFAGGFTEVLISPLLEACPTSEKASEMSLLHSFYCWGQAAVIAFSTVFFMTVGIEYWRILPFLWAIVPFLGFLLFTCVPIYTLIEEPDRKPLRTLFSSARFWLFILMMLCAGASEMIMSQWSSSFCEVALGVSKSLGDLLGPCMFALMMGISRLLYAKISTRISPNLIYSVACILCIGAYLLLLLPLPPLLSLLGCGICGLAVGPFWPGTLSRASASIPSGGVSMFALLAVAGDMGCLIAPSMAGWVAELSGGTLKAAFLFAIIFPSTMLAAVLLTRITNKRPSKQ